MICGLCSVSYGSELLSQNIQVEIAFDYQPIDGKALSGFRLYKGTQQICEIFDPNAEIFDCNFTSENGTFNFTVTAFLDDGSESLHSPPYTFTLASPSTSLPLDAKINITPDTLSGQAPFTVNLDGSSSSGDIQLANWNLGDDTIQSGMTIEHTYSTPGNYEVVLTITDSDGKTDTEDITITVTEPSGSDENQAPESVITSSSNSGSSPLQISFSGLKSVDPDGQIISYLWDFGDGSTGSGTNITHTYTVKGDYTVSLTVLDNDGSHDTATSTVHVTTAANSTDSFNFEVGDLKLTDSWVRVSYNSPFTHPVVIAGPPSYNGGEPCVVRLRNIDSTGFEIRLQEWNYLDGRHITETVSYMVMEAGSFLLEDGTRVEAGSFTATTDFKKTIFKQPFSSIPVVLSSVATFNGSDTVSGQTRAINSRGFTYKMREQESKVDGHVLETVDYIAWEEGTNTLGGMSIEVGTTADEVSDQWHKIDFTPSADETPLFFASMQTTDGPDTAALRQQNLNTNSVQIKVEEEKSLNAETAHTTEKIGYLILNSSSFQNEADNDTITYAINFQPANAEIPEGFTPDSGKAYSAETGYGWIIPTNTKMARDRNSDLSPDQSYDTTLPAIASSVWKISLPNGKYNVAIAIGEASWHPGKQYLQINGHSVIDNFYPDNDQPWFEKDVIITVNNQEMVLTFENTNYTQLNWIKITRIHDSSYETEEQIITMPINYAINFQPSNAVIPEGFTPDSGKTYNAKAGYGWIIPTNTNMARDRNSYLSPDQSYDTTLPAIASSVWKISLPNGKYSVTISIGEASWHPGKQYLQINGQSVIDNFYPDNDHPWFEKEVIITVNNQEMVLTFENTNYTQLNWIKIHNIFKKLND